MKKMLGMLFLAGVMLLSGQTVLADMVGEKFSQTEAFQQYVATQKRLEEQDARLDKELSAARDALRKSNVSAFQAFHDALRASEIFMYIFMVTKTTFVCIVLLSFAFMVFYIYYLIRFNPMKWKLMTSGGTLRRLWKRLMQRNSLAGMVFLLAVCLPGVSLAKTNVLQDIKMYYSGNEFEKGYVLCKYSDGKTTLGYTEVNGVAVIPRPEPGFDLTYDVMAHSQGLGLGVAAEDFEPLYEQAKTDAHRALVFSLLARTGKDVANAGAMRLVTAIISRRGQDIEVSIERFKALLAAFADSNNRLLANGLVRLFLEKSVDRVKNLAGLDSLVDLAVDNEAFEIIREATASAMKSLPSRLPFIESVYAARIYFKIDKDMARHYFQNIRSDFPEFLKSEAIRVKLEELFKEMASVVAFLPLYDNDALYTALRRQPNELRVAITGFFDTVDPALAAVAYNSIGMEPGDLVFRNPDMLALLARLTSVYKKDAPAEFLNSLKRAVVEYDVPYSGEQLLAAVEKVRQNPSGFIESVLTQDMNTDCRFNRNSNLIMAFIKALTPEQITAFESYFVKKSALHEEILDYLFTKEKGAFYRLLVNLYAADAGSVAMLEFPNDIMDLKTMAPAFSKESLKLFATLPAGYFVAHHALSRPTPDVRLAKQALVPEFDELFQRFLSQEKQELSEKDAITGLILLTLAEKPGATVFADEAFVLGKMLAGYFDASKHAELSKRVEEKTSSLAELKEQLADSGSVPGMVYVAMFYFAFLFCYVIAAAVFSFKYACNMMIPGKDFTLLRFFVNDMEAVGTFSMTTIWFFPVGLGMVLVAQLLRGAVNSDTMNRDMREAVAALVGQPPFSPSGDADGGGSEA
ncbi:hypothetical protein G3N56_12390 [Desulfovibrio sulfodismutans]|uniref:Uncharacterized protein n=1 Tax=Desulfolutivibrio sulfodismutans TaxID=63561 RepID=A0A7K3NMV8_9BACT|nr:hypothetical protein [Desulfolutivibrio sulfodismutans]NDY57532.1 hypothetical protein [Desulfolutivibrio sulfodismutans]QLA14338.1 hypothetical protein GD606_19745 [Desulfolutivibrio sulfodismutans DSM 3696]